MKPPETIYRGERLYDRQVIVGARVTVNGRELSILPSQKLRDMAGRFEWGYRGAGPSQLALALILDATGSPALALAAYQYLRYWFGALCVRGDAWQLTAGDIQQWLSEWAHERESSAAAELACDPVKRCRECGCTDWDCRQCIAATGHPCSWVEGEEPPICTRCADAEDAALIAEMNAEGGAK